MRRARGTIDVFTFKDGLLARAAHDLALRCDHLDAALQVQSVTATIPLAAISVVGPVEDGVIRDDLYDDGKRREIEGTMRDQILRADRHPDARFQGNAVARADGGYDVSGDLELAGRRAPLSFTLSRDGDGYRSRFELQPSRWGITPYKALLGAIKLKDVVRVELSLREI